MNSGGEAGAPPDHDEPLQRVASFAILEEIGRGGMGIVYRARDLKLEREVALKRPLPEYLERPDFHQRFMAEARSASKLMHPNITTVFEVFEDEGIPWMVMELIDGASLRSMLTGHHPIPFENVLRYAEGLTDALRVAHLGGILHRDINPNNILVGMDGRARLNDFGLARAWRDPESGSSGSDDSTDTRSVGWVAGTRGYMSPEQALGKSMDPRSDIFSLGLVYYEMCTGRSAFDWRESDDWLDALLHREPRPIPELNAEVPIEFQEIVHKATAKRTFQRYQSANEMLLDVRATRRKLQSDTGSGPPPFHRRSRIKGWWYAMGGAIAVAVLVGSWFANRGTVDPARSINWDSRQLTSAPGWEAQPAVAPGGSLIAFTSNESGNSDIWLLDVNGGNSLQLTHDAGSDSDPAWFPDESNIAFVSERGGSKSIWKIPRLGGSPVMLIHNAKDPAISPDGQSIAFARPGAAGFHRIAIASLADPSGAVELTDEEDGLWDHENPSWSPDGSTLCYSDFRDLWLVSTGGGPAQVLTTEHAIDGEPAWTPDGRRIYFSSMRGGSFALWSLSLSGEGPQRLTPGTGPERHPSLSGDGRRITYSTFAEGRDVVVLDRQTRQRYRLSTSRYESAPDLAPDGGSVVYVSNMGGKFDLWFQLLERGRPTDLPVRLTDHPGSVALPTFSNDGRWIAYCRVFEGQRDIWLVPATGGMPIQITDDPAADLHPTFSPRGDRMVFVSNRDGLEHLWIVTIEEGKRVGSAIQLTDGDRPDIVPAWSPDGLRIAFVRDGDVWMVSADGSGQPVRLTYRAQAQVVRWDQGEGDLIVSGTWATDGVELRRVAEENGVVRPFDPPVVFGDANAFGLFGVSGDGRYVSYLAIQSGGDLWMMEAQSTQTGF